ncbi:penicillin-insensitive murein endopeptidase [Azospirillum brasilense]|uniref:penicillin-insensitive murein endopeptidase n=1 Tax=Azospirillum argentinense TaxID=2970906 RepID=UPI00190EE887|nr:penicillin-insensitive murein endopeptidase [Azospirillum argentinense]MBK3803761.1 penicillin-insensitive murein endopeptidase [Azospirillum argentinense]
MGRLAIGPTIGILAAALVAAGLVAAALAGPAEAGSSKKKKPAPPAPNSIAWSQVSGPALGPAQSIGGYAAGCITGAQALPGEGTGYQVIRMSRQRYYGHPELIDYLKGFGRKVAAAGLGTALIGDMGQARGGPMSFGHASHQIGLDADVWLRLDHPPMGRNARESLSEIKYVDYGRVRVTEDWSERQAQLVRIAASDPRVTRIFVNPAIKLAMCRHSWPDRAFLRKLRPWHGHDGHMHIRLGCPAGSPQCEDQRDIPDGDGCGDEVASWLGSVYPVVERHNGKPQPRYVSMPPACTAVLRAAGTRVAAMDDPHVEKALR